MNMIYESDRGITMMLNKYKYRVNIWAENVVKSLIKYLVKEETVIRDVFYDVCTCILDISRLVINYIKEVQSTMERILK